MITNTRLPEFTPSRSFADGDGNAILNQIVLQLPTREREALFPKLEFVRLKAHQVQHEAGDTLKSAYLINSGLISVLSVFPDGQSVEVGLVGKEGFIGQPLVAGFRSAATCAITQIEGSGFRIDAEVLSGLLQVSRSWSEAYNSLRRSC